MVQRGCAAGRLCTGPWGGATSVDRVIAECGCKYRGWHQRQGRRRAGGPAAQQAPAAGWGGSAREAQPRL